MEMTLFRYDAFTIHPERGNPAGIVFDAHHLSDATMQQIAHAAGFNETAFILPSDHADWRFRFFTPGQEVDLCGHATVASLVALHERQLLPKSDLLLETRAGILPISVELEAGRPYIWMTQNPAQFIAFNGDRAALAHSIGLQVADLDASLPIVYGSTGLWTLIVPVSGLDAMRRMQPDNAVFPDVLQQMPRASLHPICMQTVDPLADMHARHFSSPYSGTVEDAVTGTASGVMGAYYQRYIAHKSPLLIEQGLEIGRDGRVLVTVTGETVRIRGTAVLSQTMTIPIR